MDRMRVLEQFKAVTPEVNIIRHEVPDEAEDPIADAYDVRAMPTLIFEDMTSGLELARAEGGMNLSDLRKLYGKAQAVATGDAKVGKKQQKYGPRVGGYDGVKTRAEQEPSTPEPEPEPEDDEQEDT